MSRSWRWSARVALVMMAGVGGGAACSNNGSGENNTSGNNTTATNNTTGGTNTTGETNTTTGGTTNNTTPPPSEGTFSLLTYNVAGLPAALSGSEPDRNQPVISPLLNSFDVILAQEDFYYHHLLTKDLDEAYFRGQTWYEAKGYNEPKLVDLGDGLFRASRYELGPVDRVAWSDCNGDATSCASDCLATKGYSFSELKLPGDRVIHVYNIHKEAGGCPKDDEIRAEGVEQLIGELQTRSAGKTVIIAGDYNLHVDSAEDPQDRVTFQRLIDGGALTDVCWQLECGDERIDRIVYKNGEGVTLEPTRWWVPEAFVWPEDGSDLSDHKPVAASFTWRAATP